MERDDGSGGGGDGRVKGLIEKATNSTAREVDPRLLKAIKYCVRYSDPDLHLASQTLMGLMKRDHSQVRYLALLVIDELFMRSKLFRTLMANAARIQRERQEREVRTKEILRNKFESLREDFSAIKDEIDETIKEIKECLEIVQAKGDAGVPLAMLDEEDLEEFRSLQLRQIRFDSLRESEKIQETNENRVVFDALREQCKLLVTKHLVSVQEWISVLIRVEVADNRTRDSMLKEFIDIRNNILAVKKKCEEAGFALPKATGHGKEEMDDEEDIWEEGEGNMRTESVKVMAPDKGNQEVGNSSMSSSSETKRPTSGPMLNETLISKDYKNRRGSLRDMLLAEAPLVKWGSQLSNWDSTTEVLANHRGLELESHWGRVDQDAVIPAEKIAELNLQATVYKEDRSEILPCRAPLRKGGLCERRDLRVCPFHGPIIPRDDEGNPISQEPSLDERVSSSAEEKIDQDFPMHETVSDTDHDHLARKVAKQAVKNIRERDKEEMRKRANRAKLAKVRQHNDSVLRDAALASTSRSAAVVDDDEFDRLAAARNKKESLSSMLHMKVTAKDRLTQRLLNNRTKGAATRQLTQKDDERHRESSANQW
ncbi:PREDICTED: UV-stimulated scaffold protein A homolog isoform X2 [Tarenaya hassleriana]|uniref:UV-stimulated scaffold protein A homolog isoform X2 n=1 Tax=Tarenaya hassleriana TaxID=28532 RepID=UPI00053C1FD1|nr:PREDICTED: UV-stimulated scaffold protein A homolog isoform X2 [Tarenaya hassleriana]